jgi:hypothetical protein
MARLLLLLRAGPVTGWGRPYRFASDSARSRYANPNGPGDLIDEPNLGIVSGDQINPDIDVRQIAAGETADTTTVLEPFQPGAATLDEVERSLIGRALDQALKAMLPVRPGFSASLATPFAIGSRSISWSDAAT